ncbi:MAG: hypothetical protein HKN47_15275 [Pirellulaceae bacterium]|nr:hypothetical protein [Pirellulaceae bacterium]
MQESNKEIEELLDDWSDGELDEQAVEQLRGRLRDDAAARTRYVQWQVLNAALQLEFAAGAPSLDRHADVTVESRPRSSMPIWKMFLTIAAGLAIMVLVARWTYLEWVPGSSGDVPGRAIAQQRSDDSPSLEPTAQGIALVTRLVDAKWQDGENSVSVGEALTPGRLHLSSGYAQIEFFCGATVVLEGPAEMELISSTAARFLDGRLRAQVPPAARGFEIDVDGMKVVDLGTEFGISVTPDGSDVQVFDGEVELHRPESDKKLVTAGQAFLHGEGQLTQGVAKPGEFVDLAALDSRAKDQTVQRFERWRAYSKQLRQDPRLIAYYAPDESDRWQRKLHNQAIPIDSELDGAIVGARRVAGRWPDKGALEFKLPGDRVRVNIPGEFRSLTFACWVKIDSLDRWYNSLFLTDNYQSGEPHWQILDTGQLFFSVRPGEQARAMGHREVLSPVFWDPSMSGQWLHLATTYDVDAKTTTHYLNGQLLHQESIPDIQLVPVTRIGMATIGNWSVPTKPDAHFAIRNLNGSLDELVIFQAALSADEIAEMYTSGSP